MAKNVFFFDGVEDRLRRGRPAAEEMLQDNEFRARIEGGFGGGSTSNYFRTKEILMYAVVDHFAEKEKAAWEGIAALVQPRTRDELAAALTAYVRRATGPDRPLTIARYSLFVEAAVRPPLQRRLAETAAAIQQWGAQWLHAVGSKDPQGDCRRILNQLEGIILHEIAFANPTADLGHTVKAAVHALLTA